MKIYFICLLLILFSCSNAEESYYQPANPPSGIQITTLTGDYAGDYLLTFRSENRSNKRFGGFLIFTGTDRTALSQMTGIYEASYILGTANSDTENYNLGINNQVVILFSNAATYGNITINNVTYTVTKELPKDARVTAGYYLAMKTYLIDTGSGEIVEVSDAGNIVLIP